MNYQDVRIVPLTTNQDDIENYFSLQRNRISGGEVTVQHYLEGNTSLATGLLVKAENEDINSECIIHWIILFYSYSKLCFCTLEKEKKPLTTLTRKKLSFYQLFCCRSSAEKRLHFLLKDFCDIILCRYSLALRDKM